MGRLTAHVTVLEWERVLLLRDGRIDRVLEPGRHRYRPRRSRLLTVDMRPRLLLVPGQELLTSDGVTLRVSVQLRWQVVDPTSFVTGAESAQQVLYAAAQEAVRGGVGAVTLDEILADRSRLSDGFAEVVAERVESVGIRVESVQARDLMLPGELRKAAMDVVVARERGRAELERARSEAASLRSLTNVARMLEEHPALLQLRTLQTASEVANTVVVTPQAVSGSSVS